MRREGLRRVDLRGEVELLSVMGFNPLPKNDNTKKKNNTKLLLDLRA